MHHALSLQLTHIPVVNKLSASLKERGGFIISTYPTKIIIPFLVGLSTFLAPSSSFML